MEGVERFLPLLNILPVGLVLVIWNKFDKIWTAIENIVNDMSTKEYSDDTFQRKDRCDDRFERLKEDVDEIKKDVKELLKRGA